MADGFGIGLGGFLVLVVAEVACTAVSRACARAAGATSGHAGAIIASAAAVLPGGRPRCA